MSYGKIIPAVGETKNYELQVMNKIIQNIAHPLININNKI